MNEELKWFVTFPRRNKFPQQSQIALRSGRRNKFFAYIAISFPVFMRNFLSIGEYRRMKVFRSEIYSPSRRDLFSISYRSLASSIGVNANFNFFQITNYLKKEYQIVHVIRFIWHSEKARESDLMQRTSMVVRLLFFLSVGSMMLFRHYFPLKFDIANIFTRAKTLNFVLLRVDL